MQTAIPPEYKSNLPPHLFGLMADSAMVEAKRIADERKRGSGVKFRGSAERLFNCRDREVILSGPAGTGKSMACLTYMHRLAYENPGFRGLIVRSTRSSLSETGMVTFEDRVLGADHPMMVGGPRRQWRTDYRYDNGALIVLGGMDKPSKVLSGEYDVIYVQQAEELTEAAWETLITRLRNYKIAWQQIIGDCNPDAPRHWIKRRADAGALTMLESRHEDNPELWNGVSWTEKGKDYLSKLDSLTGVRLHRLRFGRWVAAEGAIYEEWDRNLHVIDPFEIPRSWRRFRTVDFGFTNPVVVQWWAVDNDDRLFMYREYYHTKKTVREVADIIKRWETWYKTYKYGPLLDDNGKPVHYDGREQVHIAICDHDAEDRATLEAEGIATIPADKRIKVGIEAVQHRLKKADDGKPRLFILRDASIAMDRDLMDAKRPFSTEQEFDSYIWLNKDNKDVPIDRDNHGLDALRYAVMHLDAPGAFGFDALSGSAQTHVLTPARGGTRNWNPTGVEIPSGNRWRV